jgi:hypothetical protein
VFCNFVCKSKEPSMKYRIRIRRVSR